MAEPPELDPARVGPLTYALVAAGLAIIYLFPRIMRAVPSPLVTILILTALVWTTGWDVRTVGDMGALPDTLLVFLTPDVPLSFEMLAIIFPYAFAVAIVGLLESLMTQNLVEEPTDTTTMLRRHLLYTGVTRGRKLGVLVGQRKAVAIAVGNVAGRRRWTKLAEWLAAA